MPLHTQGRCLNLSFAIVGVRFTSAYAEKIFLFLQRPAHSSDHPRIRGENQIQALPVHRFEGSPPHTRGKSSATGQSAQAVRITPAYAGKISGHADADARRAHHPRIRGENLPKRCHSKGFSGSPPHTRGKSYILYRCSTIGRITPAYAGKIKRELCSHPRTQWITPAYAGKMGRSHTGCPVR